MSRTVADARAGHSILTPAGARCTPNGEFPSDASVRRPEEGLPAQDEAPGLVAEGAHDDEDDVDDHADTEQTAGQQPDDAGADLADVETVNTEESEKDCQQQAGQS